MMKSAKIATLTSVLAFLAGMSPQTRADVLDGGFETPATTTPNELNAGNVPETVGSSFGGPSNNAWTVVLKGTLSNNVAITSTSQYFMFGSTKEYYNANSGLQWLDLTGSGDNGAENGVQQTIATTPGQMYAVSFYVGYESFNSTPATTELDVNGVAVGTYANSTASTFPTYNGDGVAVQTWKNFTYTFAATDSSTTLAFYNLSPAGNSVNGLDDVSVTATPEPASLGVLVVGGVGLLLRRRKARA
jgi:hypothetical protein